MTDAADLEPAAGRDEANHAVRSPGAAAGEASASAAPASDALVPEALTAEDPIPLGFRDLIERILHDFTGEQGRVLAPLGPDIAAFLDVAHAAVTGGKRMRAAFVYWGWRAAGGTPTPSTGLIRAAAAVELLHASALVHDDVIDESATRRGRPAAHIALTSQLADLGSGAAYPSGATPRRLGEAAAILLGDLLLGWSSQLFESSGLRERALRRGRPQFDRLRSEVMAGQFLDVVAQARPRTSAAEALRVVRYKSAAYTVARPLQLGAALGGADSRLLAALASYGLPLGEAFQLRDDLLGVFGDQAVTGKPNGDDIREGKRTFLVARALDLGDADQRALIEDALGDSDLGEDRLDEVREALRASGAVAAVETVISELTAAALSALRRAPVADAEAAAALRVLGDLATNRTG